MVESADEASHAPGAVHFPRRSKTASVRSGARIRVFGAAVIVDSELVALFKRAVTLQNEGRLAEAAALYESVLRHDDRIAEAHNNLGHVRHWLGQNADAIASLRRAVALRPGLKEAHNCLGAALQATGAYGEAIDSYRKALAIEPDYADALDNLGAALRETGDMAGAVLHLRRALALNPRIGRTHRLLVEMAAPVDASHLEQMEQLVDPQSLLATAQRVEVYFALGAAYAASGDYERAFANLRDGNALKRSTLPYNERKELDALERVAQAFPPAMFDAAGTWGDPSPTPTFIFGMPRSGTTLVEQMLAAHPDVHAGGELGVCAQAAADFTIDADPADAAAYAKAIADGFAAMGAHCARRLEALARAERVTDKWPWSFKFAGTIALALPNARMIHVRRDPLDSCFSCFATLFTNDLPYMYDLAEIGRYYRAYEGLMTHWNAVLPPGAILHVQYEELVASFEQQARRIVDHCGLAWNDACLEFATVRRPIRTASAVSVRRPLNRGGVGRADPYRQYLAPLVEALNLL